VPKQSLQQGGYHLPVLAATVVECLATAEARLIVDATLGDGGHSLALLDAGNAKLRIIGLDVDPNSLAVAQARLAKYKNRCSFSHGNFRHITSLLTAMGSTSIDGVLADLGLSSRQIDLPERGLSYLEEGPLDLRLDPSLPRTAAELLAALEQDELVRLLRDYGEEQRARAIARAVILKRRSRAIDTTTELRRIIEGVVRGPLQVKSVARVFQALRIAVNDELGALQEFLPQAFALLQPGGRLAVISYHSLEDRIVKQQFREWAKTCTCPPELPVCVCGQKSRAIVLTAKPILPAAEEIKLNRRARSAKLRVLQKR
jgi:16S rRNA (cytosine1402-N4)-methyltransferase